MKRKPPQLITLQRIADLLTSVEVELLVCPEAYRALRLIAEAPRRERIHFNFLGRDFTVRPRKGIRRGQFLIGPHG